MGYLGSLSQKGLGKIFSKCVFLNLLSPLGLPIPSYALLPAKKLKNFPKGCALDRRTTNSNQFELPTTPPLHPSSWESTIDGVIQECRGKMHLRKIGVELGSHRYFLRHKVRLNFVQSPIFFRPIFPYNWMNGVFHGDKKFGSWLGYQVQ